MNPQMAGALLAYLQRYSGIPGGSLGEAQQICAAIPILEGVAAGHFVMSIVPAEQPKPEVKAEEAGQPKPPASLDPASLDGGQIVLD